MYGCSTYKYNADYAIAVLFSTSQTAVVPFTVFKYRVVLMWKQIVVNNTQKTLMCVKQLKAIAVALDTQAIIHTDYKAIILSKKREK